MTYKVRSKPRPDPENEPCFYRIHKLAPLPIFLKGTENNEYLMAKSSQESDMQLALMNSMSALNNSRMPPARPPHIQEPSPPTLTATNGTAPLGSRNALASMVAHFSLETNRMTEAELERSLRINLLQQQQCLLRGQSSVSQQQGNLNLASSMQNQNPRGWHPR